MNSGVCKSDAGLPGSQQIRPASPEDLDAIVRVHVASFTDFFLTTLGPRFLRVHYGLMLRFDQNIFLVAESEEKVVGFAAGVVDVVRFYRMMAANKWRYAIPVLLGVARHPTLLIRLLRNTRRVVRPQQPAHAPSETSCELCGIAVHPEFSGQGCGKQLVQAFVESARRRNATSVHLTTDALDNDPVNEFYQRRGFRLTRTFEAPGQPPRNEYVFFIREEHETGTKAPGA